MFSSFNCVIRYSVGSIAMIIVNHVDVSSWGISLQRACPQSLTEKVNAGIAVQWVCKVL